MNSMNPVVHFEMPAEDKKRMSDFYTSVFGWQTEVLGPEMGDYTLVTTTENGENGMPKNPGAINGGFYKKSKDTPEHPSVVIEVSDIRASVKKVTETGGKVLGEPQKMPGVGEFVYFKDTEGNTVGMLQPASIG